MSSTLKLGLRTAAEVVTNAAKVVKAGVQVHVESGHLQDTLEDLCDLGGAAGAVFKLGAMALGDAVEADAETRIASTLATTFLKTLDERLDGQLKQPPKKEFVTAAAWKQIKGEHLEGIAAEALKTRFTWLSVLGEAGRKSGRNWPLVHDLANLARSAAWEAALLGGAEAGNDLRRFTDDLRGAVFSELMRAVAELEKDDTVRTAFRVESDLAYDAAMKELAAAYAGLDHTYLFQEFPQSALFVPPKVRHLDYGDEASEKDWDKITPQPNGDEVLFEAIRSHCGSAQLIVLEGEMGAGKSCLMRKLAAQLAEQYAQDAEYGVLFVNWRDIYERGDLTAAIAEHVRVQHGLSLTGLKEDKKLVFVIDGFDEMRAHDPAAVSDCFRKLVKLAEKHRSPVLLAMRSTITEPLRRVWQEPDIRAQVYRVDEFTDAETDAWAANWAGYRATPEVTGERLREMCGGIDGLTHNPLLLFMLARYVEPVAGERGEPLSRAEIFRTFIDETIQGKARQSGERAGVDANWGNYRFLLQEIAWIASWPKNGGKCPERLLQDRCNERDLKDLGLESLRSAFVLHFFEPGDAQNEFEFHPEAFRHYLLAEWAVRTQWEAFLYDGETPPYPTGRSRDEAMNALAQFPLVKVERELANEICEELPTRLASNDGEEQQAAREAFGLGSDADVVAFFNYVKRNANLPTPRPWQADTRIGVMEGHETIPPLQQNRLLACYWDSTMLTLFGLARGCSGDVEEQPLFEKNPAAISQLQALSRCSNSGWWTVGWDFDYSHLSLDRVSLTNCVFNKQNFIGARLSNAHAHNCSFVLVKMSAADLSNSLLFHCDLHFADLSNGVLRETTLAGSYFGDAKFDGALMSDISVSSAGFSDDSREAIRCDFRNATFIDASISYSDRYCSLVDSSSADLSGALMDKHTKQSWDRRGRKQ